MIKYINVTRYLVGILVPIVLLSFGLNYSVIAVVIILLFINNTLDDIFFYVGNKDANESLYKGGIISPVNGVVTKIERDVKLFSNIIKQNVLTNYVYMTPFFEKKDGNYKHVVVFLNKLNQHIVVNPFDVKKIHKHYTDGTNQEMVLDGELVSNNYGPYLHNDSIVIDYGECIVVLTLDKYISDYEVVSENGKEVGVVICKGSQCDIYIPNNKEILCKEGDVLNIFQTIVEGKNEIIDIKRSKIKESIKIGFSHSGGVYKIVLNNLVKTLRTFRYLSLSVLVFLCLLLSLYNECFVYGAIFVLYCFTLDRFYKNLMYSTMNIIGLKKWMKISYNYINKITLLWKKS